MTTTLTKPKEKTGQAFLIALAAAALLFVPFLIIDRGLFIYYGDFNVQQIPFYKMAHDCIRSGKIFWNWNTDLGANFIGSYSFYLLGSPFFWLTLPFPSAAVPYLMGPLLILKFACASVCAYLFLRRFVRPDYAVIGGLLYAFSGFSVYNVFFNHFHEAIVYFPLMLLGLEWYMKDGRRGLFAVTVFLSALSNYYFFIGQVFFLLIYWFVRMLSGDWECTLSKFLWLCFEAIVGTAGAAVLLLPSYLAVIQNPRTDSMLAGWDFLIYNKPQRLFDILHSFFFPQDIPARENFFPDSDNKWASMSAWLPVFGCTGAIAYFQSRKHSDWLRRMLIICFFCAVIPGLNAMFQLFNWAYYARWYYMMVLILVLATVMCFEQADDRPVEWKRAFGWSFGITAFFALFIGLMPKSWTPNEETGQLEFGLMKVPDRFWIFVAIAVVCLVLALLLVTLFQRERTIFYRWGVGVVACVSLIYSWYLLGLGKANSNFTSDFVIDRGILGADKIHLPDEDFARVDLYDGMDNQAMFWGLPSIYAFHSIVPGSVMEFYPTVGIPRGVATRAETSHYAVRSFLSTRWLFDYANKEKKEYKDKFFEQDGVTEMPGWHYVEEQNGFSLYENDFYVPMGFTYDYYLTRTEYDELSESSRELALLKALVVEDAQAEKAAEVLSPLADRWDVEYTEAAYYTDCQDRRAETAETFAIDRRGFTATIRLAEDNYVFFSVPQEDGWTATVDGKPAEILTANVGFMAVLCPGGKTVTIRFDYMTPGLKYGLMITLGAALLFLLYLLLMRRFDRRMREKTRPADPAGADAFPDLFGGEEAQGPHFPLSPPPQGEGNPPEEGHPEPDEGDKGAITAEETGASEDADHIRSEKPAETEAVPPPKSDDGEPPFDLYQFYPGSRPADGRQDDGKPS